MQKAVILLQKVIVSSVTLLVEIPVHNQWVPVIKQGVKERKEIENTWAFMQPDS